LGCTASVTRQINVTEFPLVTAAFTDTLICNKDSVRLQATASAGNMSWTPNYNIIGANTASPVVYPKFTIDYIVAANNNGCIGRDTVRIRLLPVVQMTVSNDTAICPGFTAPLQVSGNAKSWHWTPINRIAGNADTSHITAVPSGAVWYRVTGIYNNCSATDSVLVTMLPLPAVYAGPDTLICLGGSFQNPIVAAGDEFWWNYTGGIDNPAGLNPRFTPTHTYRYILSTRNFTGCTRVNRDTVLVQVYRAFKTDAGPDQVIVAGQTVQLQGSGAGSQALWSPALGLNNNGILNPLASPLQTQVYTLKVTGANGCTDSDTARVTVYKTEPEIFVADAFSPNGDGVNDVLYAVPVGITKLEYFKVFNRWGRLVFSTADYRKGWNGAIGGSGQETDTYVWIARGIDYKGNVVQRKGTVLLIR
jgi:gliding motility-associated-like protein